MNDDIKTIIYEALNAAHENGYTFERYSTVKVADEMITLVSDLEGLTVEDVEPIVRQYFAERW